MRNAVITLAVVAALTGCTVGPRYREPAAPLPASFDRAAGTPFSAEPVAPELWRSFEEPELTALIERALRENRSIAQVQARLDEARALRGLTVFGLLPTVTASADRERSDPSSLDPFLPAGQPATTVYRAGFDASWEIDLFGASRRAASAARSETTAREGDLDAARASTAAEVAQAWFALRGAQARLDIQRHNLDNLRDNQRILEARLEAGRGTEFDVARAQSLVAGIAAQLPETEAEVTRQEQRLAVLVALPVAELRGKWLAPSRPVPNLAPIVAVGTPADWLRRRPDIRAAERRLSAATAKIGVEQADWLPRISLLGGFGYTAQARDDLFDRSAERWRYGPSIVWSFLDAGRVRQRVRAAKARGAEALAAYDDTVLRALEETENALAGYRAANESLAANQSGLDASRRAAEFARVRYDAGASDYVVVLDAERTLLEFESSTVQASVARATALAVLNKALAGDFVRAER